jgi:CheY-like chemotaxis protein
LNNAPGRILLVEDDPHDIELVQMALEEYQLTSALDIVMDGEQALHYLLGQGEIDPPQPLPQLILLDLKLPRISGIQVLQTIRASPRTHRLIVVVMTSSEEDLDVETCYDLGANSYVVKPVNFQRFLNVAQQVGLYWMHFNKSPFALS